MNGLYSLDWSNDYFFSFFDRIKCTTGWNLKRARSFIPNPSNNPSRKVTRRYSHRWISSPEWFKFLGNDRPIVWSHSKCNSSGNRWPRTSVESHVPVPTSMICRNGLDQMCSMPRYWMPARQLRRTRLVARSVIWLTMSVWQRRNVRS